MSIKLSNEEATIKLKKVQQVLEELHYWSTRIQDGELERHLANAHDSIDDAMSLLDVWP